MLVCPYCTNSKTFASDYSLFKHMDSHTVTWTVSKAKMFGFGVADIMCVAARKSPLFPPTHVSKNDEDKDEEEKYIEKEEFKQTSETCTVST